MAKALSRRRRISVDELAGLLQCDPKDLDGMPGLPAVDENGMFLYDDVAYLISGTDTTPAPEVAIEQKAEVVEAVQPVVAEVSKTTDFEVADASGLQPVQATAFKFTIELAICLEKDLDTRTIPPASGMNLSELSGELRRAIGRAATGCRILGFEGIPKSGKPAPKVVNHYDLFRYIAAMIAEKVKEVDASTPSGVEAGAAT